MLNLSLMNSVVETGKKYNETRCLFCLCLCLKISKQTFLSTFFKLSKNTSQVRQPSFLSNEPAKQTIDIICKFYENDFQKVITTLSRIHRRKGSVQKPQREEASN